MDLSEVGFGLFFIVYIAGILGVVVCTLLLLRRMARAQERTADLLERVLTPGHDQQPHQSEPAGEDA